MNCKIAAIFSKWDQLDELRKRMDSILDYQELIIRMHKVFHFIHKNVSRVFPVCLIFSDLLISRHMASSAQPMESGYHDIIYHDFIIKMADSQK